MKKNRITVKLIAYFSISLIILSVVMATTFTLLSKNNILEVEQKNMEDKAKTMAVSLSELMSSNNVSSSGNSGNGNNHSGTHGAGSGYGSGFGAYLRFIGDIAMSDVWVIDSDKQLVSQMMSNHSYESYTYKEMPQDALNIIDDVLKNKTINTRGFSEYLNQPSVSVGAPIVDSNNKVIGAVILHSSIDGIEKANSSGLMILVISISLSFVISLLLAIIFSYVFTRPLRKLNDNTKVLAQGDFLERNDIKQNDEIGDLGKNINKLAEYLYDAKKNDEKLKLMRQDFIANITHELKTPVAVIKSQLEAVEDGVINDKQQVFNQIYQETIVLDNLLYDLLELSKLQSTEFKIEKNKVIVNDIVNDIIRSYTNEARKKNIDLVYNNNDIVEVDGDYQRLRQLLSILVDNALKFSNNDTQVIIKVEKDNIQVIDYGRGISKEELPYIFDRFYFKKEGNNNGNGLGLAIAKEIANKHNFRIEVNQDEGTNFIIHF